jgi:8-oxoguanine deaminase
MSRKRVLLRDVFHLVTSAGGERRRGVDVLIDGGRIADIGQSIPRGDSELIDCSTKLVVPGFVNTHHHMFQTLTRNIPSVQNAELFDWLVGLYPIWAHLTAEAIHVSTQLACAELLKTGCTTTSDHHYLFPQSCDENLIAVQIRAAASTGIRFCATRGSMSRGTDDGGLPPQSVVQDEERILADSEQLISRYHDDEPFSMCRVALAPCSPFSVSEKLMRETADLARRHGVRLHTHLAETIDEELYCLEHYGCRPLALMERLDWLGSDVWYAHGIHFNDQELALLADTKTGVAHCPTSNMRLGSGFCRVPELMKAEVPLGLAVDGSASNDSSDMLGELRNCLLLQRVKNGAAAITAEQVLELGTRGGARLLGWETIGTIDVGQAADLAIFELERLDYAGALADPLAAIIFSGASHFTHTTIVNGEVVVSDGQLKTVDERELTRDANAISRELVS